MRVKKIAQKRYTKSWKSNLGYLVRQAFKRGVLCPLDLECDTFETLEGSYLSIKNSTDIDDMHIARMYRDIYKYGTIHILDDKFDDCESCNLSNICKDTCLQWKKVDDLLKKEV